MPYSHRTRSPADHYAGHPGSSEGTIKMKRIAQRNEIAPEATWNAGDLYLTHEAWEADFQLIKKSLPEISALSGKLTTAEDISRCFRLTDEMNRVLDRLYVYAHVKHHENTADPFCQGPVDRIKRLAVDAGQATSFIDPELLLHTEEELLALINHPTLREYRFTLEKVLRSKPHILPKDQEALLARASALTQAAQTIYSMLNNADMKFPAVKDDEGNEIELTHSRYGLLMESRSRDVRRGAFKAMFSSYMKQKNTIASIFNAHIQDDLFYAQTQKYPGTLEMALFPDNIPGELYSNLIATVHRQLPLFHQYLDVRKKILGLDELHLYDLTVPLVAGVDWRITYTEAQEIITRALAPLGNDYGRIIEEAWRGRWIDVYENEGKRSGAYSWGAYGVHPYILLNHEDTLQGMFTIAHELGHAIHSHLADSHQPFRYAQYTIFIAEIASTLNEALLVKYLLAQTSDPAKRRYLLAHHADDFRATLFVQTLFAEFELAVHRLAETGEALTLERLNDIYYELHATYYAGHVALDSEVRIGWMRIPHFYTSFYVYKYATGFSAANTLAQRIVDREPDAVQKYLALLQSGGRDYPLNLLLQAGLDMRTPAPIEEALRGFERIVAELGND
jgi:oligoendopeptidase F